MVGVDTGASASDGYSYGFIDGDGKIVIEPQFDYVNDFSEGYAAVLQGDAWGFIGTSGTLVVRPQFQEVGDCHEGMAWFVVGDGYGYIRFAE